MSDFENFFRPRPPTFYLPGDPRGTNYVELCWRLATAAVSLPVHQRPTQMFLSATHYGALIAELRAQYDAPFGAEDPPYMIFGTDARPFKVLNAGTDDLAAVNRVNRDTPGAIDFADRLQQFEVTH